MTTLKGKAKQAARRKRGKVVSARTGSHAAMDHVTHHRVAGETKFLCGRPVGTSHDLHRPAYISTRVSCNSCKVIHKNLLASSKGRTRLGVDSAHTRPIV